MQFGEESLSLERLAATVDAARDCGFAAVSSNDHLVFQTPWLDGPTALASMIERSGEMELATTVSLATLRGPVPLAKALAAIDVLSEGRLLAALGPGSPNAITRFSASRSRSAGSDSMRRSTCCERCSMGNRCPRRRASIPFGPMSSSHPRRTGRVASLCGLKLGLECRPRARREGSRRLAGIRLQHHAGRFLRGPRCARTQARGTRARV